MSGRHAHSRIPWRRRPRQSLWDVPRLIGAVFTFPAMATGVVAYEMWAGKRHDGWMALVVYASIALGQALFLVLWLRRPVRGS